MSCSAPFWHSARAAGSFGGIENAPGYPILPFVVHSQIELSVAFFSGNPVMYAVRHESRKDGGGKPSLFSFSHI